MKLLTKITFATLITGMSLSPALVFAHGQGGHLHQRLERQQYRIEKGIDSGALTRKEAKKLRRQQRKIRMMVRHFREDGVLTRAERHKVRDKLDRASDRIWAFKHNDDRYYCENRYHKYSYHDRGQDKYEKPRHIGRLSENDNYGSGYRIKWY